MKLEINKMELSYNSYCKQLEIAEKEVRKVCDFNARITLCEGDGHLILNEKNERVAVMECLNGKTKTNKLTEEEHERFSI